jgi:hypothetical protein
MIQGDLLGGFTLMNKGRSVGLWGNSPLESTRPVWNGEDVKGKHVLFYCEAGFGDGVIFVRFAKEIANLGAKVLVICDPGLAPLFARIPEISAVVQKEVSLGVYHDYWVPSMMSPVLLKTQFKDLSGEPYLTADPKYVKKFSSYIKSGKCRAGIRWLGREGEDYVNRIFPRDLFFDAVTQDHVQLYSLQRDERSREDYTGEELPKHIIDLEILLETWEDTVGAIMNLDIIITSCTSTAHLSAAMGKPTWVIIPVMPYYIWTYTGNKSPWYKNVILFRQQKYGNWDQPFREIKERLKHYDNI